MTDNKGRVLTVLLNYKTAEMTAKSLLAARQAMQGLPGEIVVVDNDSGDGSFEYLQNEVAKLPDEPGFPHCWVLQTGHNGGFGYGNNAGIRAGLSRGDFDFFYALNSDAFPKADTIKALRDFLMSHPKAGFAGSELFGEDGKRHNTQFRFPSIWSEFEGSIGFGPVTRLLKRYQVPRFDLPEDRPSEIDWIAGASLMMRRETLEEIGLFDETFFLYFEETDLCLRAARHGWSTYYVPDSKILHIGSVSTGMGNWNRAPKFWLDSRLYYFAKNYGPLYAVGATLARLLGGSFARLRALVQPNKKTNDPKWYLTDLTRHHLQHLIHMPTDPQIPNARQAAE